MNRQTEKWSIEAEKENNTSQNDLNVPKRKSLYLSKKLLSPEPLESLCRLRHIRASMPYPLLSTISASLYHILATLIYPDVSIGCRRRH